MALVNVVDSTRSERGQRVFSNGAARTSAAYSYLTIGSASATGVIAAAPGILHSIVCGDSATATTILYLTDSASVALPIGDTSASAVAQLGTITKNTFIFDAIFNSGLCYRLSGSANLITITYAVAS